MRYRCRCSKCRQRKTLNKHPYEYSIKKYITCACGGEFIVDKYRMNIELKSKPCKCDLWWFPHRKSNKCRGSNVKVG